MQSGKLNQPGDGVIHLSNQHLYVCVNMGIWFAQFVKLFVHDVNNIRFLLVIFLILQFLSHLLLTVV